MTRSRSSGDTDAWSDSAREADETATPARRATSRSAGPEPRRAATPSAPFVVPASGAPVSTSSGNDSRIPPSVASALAVIGPCGPRGTRANLRGKRSQEALDGGPGPSVSSPHGNRSRGRGGSTPARRQVDAGGDRMNETTRVERAGRRLRWSALAVLVALVMGLAAACGDDDEGDASSAAAEASSAVASVARQRGVAGGQHRSRRPRAWRPRSSRPSTPPSRRPPTPLPRPPTRRPRPPTRRPRARTPPRPTCRRRRPSTTTTPSRSRTAARSSSPTASRPRSRPASRSTTCCRSSRRPSRASRSSTRPASRTRRRRPRASTAATSASS